MPYTYLILGSGRQGLAAAYDLVKFGEASRITLADSNLTTAQNAAIRLRELTGFTAKPLALDVRDPNALRAALAPADCALSAVPYYFNLAISHAAIETRTHLADLGGKTDIVQQQLALTAATHAAGISLVPDCGMGPGLINNLGAYAIELLDEPREIIIYDAGLPQNPTPPWNYALTFHINGLTNEMDGNAVFLRDGKIVEVPTLSEPEMLTFEGFGELEADVTSGGTSTAAFTFQNRVQRYENKVMRYPGHYEWLRAFKTLGLFREDPIEVNGQRIIPRAVYHALLEPQITDPNVRDVGILRAVGRGIKDGRAATVTIDMVDYYDESTGFTAMERLTGWHASAMMHLQVQGRIPAGAHPVESAIPPLEILNALAARGIGHTVRVDLQKFIQ
ncbi:MAG: saccharopine dehydrogenase family protein [Anaerolineales bacterium]